MPDKETDRWKIIDILLKPLGGLLTALSVAIVGFWGSNYLEQRQADETNVRLYAELMSNRERADSDLRKDMFNTAIGTFLDQEVVDIEKELLELELLAYNFHDALDLAPLFKHVNRRIEKEKSEKDRDNWRQRLTTVAREVVDKQVAILTESSQFSLNAGVDLNELDRAPYIRLIEEEIHEDQKQEASGQESMDQRLRFVVEALYADREKQRLKLRLQVKEIIELIEPDTSWIDHDAKATGETEPGDSYELVDLVDAHFNVDFFDFPMIDNTRLPGGQRCAVVLRKFESNSAQISLVYFPGSRASLKEKPFYDEIIDDLTETRQHLKNRELQ